MGNVLRCNNDQPAKNAISTSKLKVQSNSSEGPACAWFLCQQHTSAQLKLSIRFQFLQQLKVTLGVGTPHTSAVVYAANEDSDINVMVGVVGCPSLWRSSSLSRKSEQAEAVSSKLLIQPAEEEACQERRRRTDEEARKTEERAEQRQETVTK